MRIRVLVLIALALTVGATVGKRPSPKAQPAALFSHGCGGHERWKVKVLIDDPDAGAVNFTPKWGRSTRCGASTGRPVR